MFISEFFTISIIGLLAIISPGPDFAIITKISLGFGRSAGVLAAFGIAAANICHVFINLIGLSVILTSSTIIFNLMKFLGAGYLIYIGFKSLSANRSVDEGITFSKTSPVHGNKGFYLGFLTSILNPKAYLFYLSFFSVILSKELSLLTQILYGFWICLLSVLWFTSVAIFFSHPIFSKTLKNYKHWIERVTGGALLILGVRVLTLSAL